MTFDSTTITAGAAPKATRREWLGLSVLALPCPIYSMDLNVLNLAVPHLTADLAPSSAQLLWIVDIYGFVIAGALITMGTLGDRVGRRQFALRLWPRSGVPGNPRPWLISTARFKAIDTLRRRARFDASQDELVRYLEAQWSSAERSNEEVIHL